MKRRDFNKTVLAGMAVAAVPIVHAEEDLPRNLSMDFAADGAERTVCLLQGFDQYNNPITEIIEIKVVDEDAINHFVWEYVQRKNN